MNIQESLLAISAIVAFVTEIIKRVPKVGEYPKIIAMVTAGVVVGVMGYFAEGEIIQTTEVAIAVGLASYGVYDIAKGIYLKFKK